MKKIMFLYALTLLTGCMSVDEKNEALLNAVKTGNLTVAQKMLARKADVNTSGRQRYTALQMAVKNENLEMTKLLISYGADVNASRRKLHTALQLAVENGNFEIAGILVSHGANVNVSDETDYGQSTPLQLAISGGHLKIVELLISHGANVTTRNEYGDTPLHAAVKKKLPANVIGKIIAAGSDVNAKGELDYTPLHHAIYLNQDDISSLLLSKGADVSLLNRYGLTPKNMARLPEIEHKVVETASLLSNSGNWSDNMQAYQKYNDLKQLHENEVINAIVLQVIYKSEIRIKVLILAIKLGIHGSEEKLADLLMIYGDQSMAEDYLNCGSSLLEKAGTKWANAHGYNIWTGAGSHRANWGTF